MVTEDFRHLLRGEMLAHRTVLNNQSNIQILTASSKSVRGAHPQKIKLDEVDEIDPNIYEAALLVPQTKRGIKASVQIFINMHRTHTPDELFLKMTHLRTIIGHILKEVS